MVPLKEYLSPRTIDMSRLTIVFTACIIFFLSFVMQFKAIDIAIYNLEQCQCPKN